MDDKNKIGQYVILGMLILVLLGGLFTYIYGIAGGLS